MANKITNILVHGAVLSVFVSILAFLGSILGFMFTGNPIFLPFAIYSMQAIFYTLIAALVIGLPLTGFRGH